jgi:hypothetical protein
VDGAFLALQKQTVVTKPGRGPAAYCGAGLAARTAAAECAQQQWFSDSEALQQGRLAHSVQWGQSRAGRAGWRRGGSSLQGRDLPT